MRLLNTVYITDHRHRVTVHRQSLEVRAGTQLVSRYPMAGTDAVMLIGSANITTEALGRCVRQGIRVASLYMSGQVRFVVTPPTSGNVLLRVAHYRAADDATAAAALARSFVAGKLQNFLRSLRRWADDAPPSTARLIDQQREVIGDRLQGLEGTEDGDRIRGIEGDATRRYFKALGAHLEQAAPPFVFLTRSRRPPRDPVNALLSYLYGLQLARVTGAADAVGLDPQIGFLHGLRPGRPSLALDLVEEFRPVTDRLAVRILTRRQLAPGDFTEMPGGAWYLTDAGRRRVIALYEEHQSTEVVHPLLREPVARVLLPTIQATLLARHLRGDLPAYPPFLMER